MKSYTDLEQSKKLAEILPVESADMCYRAYREEGGIPDYQATLCPYRFASWIGIPCWSLAALLEVLPEIKLEKTKAEDGHEGYYYFVSYKNLIAVPYNKEPIDGFVEMFVSLKNEDLL